MRHLIRHDWILASNRCFRSYNSFFSIAILNVLSLCFLFTLIFTLLFILSLSLTLLFFSNVTQLNFFDNVQFVEFKSNSLHWNDFISNYKHQRRAKWLSKQDYLKILKNQTKFKFKILQKPYRSQKNCSAISTQKILNLVIVIHSACNNSQNRQLMRQQIDSQAKLSSINVSYLFILGINKNQTLMKEISHESRIFNDILQLEFQDTYQNLTLKHISSLRWPLENCSKKDIIVKLDDDAFVDFGALVNRINKLPNLINSLACSVFPERIEPKRKGKWALSRQEYPFKTYPFYCSGIGYFVTPDLAFDLLDAIEHFSNKIHMIGIDDVFITGMIRSLLEPQPLIIKLNDQFEYKASRMRQWLSDVHDKCPSRIIIADIGDQFDHLNLTKALLNKTNFSWTNLVNNTAKCKKYHSQKFRSIL